MAAILISVVDRRLAMSGDVGSVESSMPESDMAKNMEIYVEIAVLSVTGQSYFTSGLTAAILNFSSLTT